MLGPRRQLSRGRSGIFEIARFFPFFLKDQDFTRPQLLLGYPPPGIVVPENSRKTLPRVKPFILGARVYSQIGPQAAASIIQKGVLHGGVGEGDVLLGEVHVPFSLLKELPFHYLPLRLQPPPPRPTSSLLRTVPCGFCSDIISTPHHAAGAGVHAEIGSDSTYRCEVCGGVCPNAPEKNAGDSRRGETDVGLLGIGVRMVFPNPTIPEAPDDSCSDGDSMDSSTLAPIAEGSGDARKGAATGDALEEGNKIVLSVYEAEELVRYRCRLLGMLEVCTAHLLPVYGTVLCELRELSRTKSDLSMSSTRQNQSSAVATKLTGGE